MTAHLLALGRRRILYAGNRLSAWANAERVAGFTAALDGAGAAPADRLVRLADGNSIESGYQLVRDALAAGDRPDAIFAFDDIMAIGARRALAEAGRRVPDDVALAGFDNIDLSALPEIDLTTVDIPKLDLGREAASLLLRLMEKRSGETNGAGTNIILETRLVVRGSCGARLAGRVP
jgi:LacI family transcriptional regulator